VNSERSEISCRSQNYSLDARATVTISGIHRAELNLKNREIVKLDAELEIAKEREAKLKRAEKLLRDENIQLRWARDERELAGNDPLERGLFFKDCQIMRLHEQVHEMRRLESFAKRDHDEPLHLKCDFVDEKLERMCSELESIVHWHSVNTPIPMAVVKRESDTGILLHCSLGEHLVWETDEHEVLLASSLSRVDSAPLIQALVLSAVREWVFQDDFPSFGNGDCPLLKAYREVLIGYG
jgi:hypothetical protein